MRDLPQTEASRMRTHHYRVYISTDVVWLFLKKKNVGDVNPYFLRSLAIDVPFCDERSKVDGFCCLLFADAVSDDTELDFEIVHQTSEQHL